MLVNENLCTMSYENIMPSLQQVLVALMSLAFSSTALAQGQPLASLNKIKL